MAGTKIAEAFVAVSAEMGGLSAGLRQGQAITTSAVNSMQRTLGGLQSMLGMIGVGVGFGAIIGGIRGTIQEAMGAEETQTRLAGAVKATGYAAGYTAEQLAGFATELQNVTTYGDENIKEAMARLLTFKKVSGETFKRTTELALDLASAGFGSVQGNAIQLGKALEDPIRGLGALRRSGVSFTESEKARIKQLVESNKLTEAQGLILDAVAGQVGGMARELAKTPTGRIKQLTQATGDLREEIGAKLMPLMVRWKEMQFNITKAVLDFVEIASPMIGGFADQWSRLNEASGGWLGKSIVIAAGAATLAITFKMVGSVIGSYVIPIFTSFAGVITGTLLRAVTMILSPFRMLGSALSIVGSVGLTAIRSLGAALSNTLSSAVGVGKAFGSLVQQGTVAAFNLLGSGAEKLGAGLQVAATLGVSALNKIDAAVRAIPWQAMWAGSRAAFSIIHTSAITTWMAIQTGAATAWMLIRNTMDPAYLRATWEGIKASATGAWESVKASAQGAWSVIRTTFEPAYLKAVWEGWRSSGESMWSRIKGGAQNTWQVIKNTFDPAYLKATWQDMKVAAANAWTSIKAGAASTGAHIASALKTGVNYAWSGMITAGKAAFATLGSMAAKTGAAMGRSLRSAGAGVAGIAGGLASLSMMGGAFAFLAPFQTMLITIPTVLSLLGSVGTVVGGLASPFMIVAGLIATAGVLWYEYSDSGKTAVAGMWQAISPIFETFKTAFGGIKDAIQAGDWKLAGEMGMVSLELAMVQGLGSIMGKWGEFTKGLVSGFLDATGQIAQGWIKMYGNLASGMLKLAQSEGPLGDLMAKVLGTDVRKMDEQQRHAFKASASGKYTMATREIDEKTARVAGLEATGGSQEEIDRLKREITEHEAARRNAAAAMEGPEAAAKYAQESMQGQLEGALNQSIQTDKDVWKERIDNANTAAMGFLDPEELEKRAKELQERQTSIAEKAAKQLEEKRKVEQKPEVMPEATPPEEESQAVGATKGSPFVGFAELNRKMQEALMKDTVAQSQLDVAEAQLGVEEEIRDELKEDAAATAVSTPAAPAPSLVPVARSRNQPAAPAAPTVEAPAVRDFDAEIAGVTKKIDDAYALVPSWGGGKPETEEIKLLQREREGLEAEKAAAQAKPPAAPEVPAVAMESERVQAAQAQATGVPMRPAVPVLGEGTDTQETAATAAARRARMRADFARAAKEKKAAEESQAAAFAQETKPARDFDAEIAAAQKELSDVLMLPARVRAKQAAVEKVRSLEAERAAVESQAASTVQEPDITQTAPAPVAQPLADLSKLTMEELRKVRELAETPAARAELEKRYGGRIQTTAEMYPDEPPPELPKPDTTSRQHVEAMRGRQGTGEGIASDAAKIAGAILGASGRPVTSSKDDKRFDGGGIEVTRYAPSADEREAAMNERFAMAMQKHQERQSIQGLRELFQRSMGSDSGTESTSDQNTDVANNTGKSADMLGKLVDIMGEVAKTLKPSGPAPITAGA